MFYVVFYAMGYCVSVSVEPLDNSPTRNVYCKMDNLLMETLIGTFCVSQQSIYFNLFYVNHTHNGIQYYIK